MFLNNFSCYQCMLIIVGICFYQEIFLFSIALDFRMIYRNRNTWREVRKSRKEVLSAPLRGGIANLFAKFICLNQTNNLIIYNKLDSPTKKVSRARNKTHHFLWILTCWSRIRRPFYRVVPSLHITSKFSNFEKKFFFSNDVIF